MRIALGLDVDAASSFAAVVAVDGASSRPRELSIAPAPVLERDESIVDATRAAIALVTRREGAAPSAVTLAHPLTWDGRRVARLSRALSDGGVAGVALVDSAFAAAVGADATRPIPIGHVVTVVALRDGGADVRVLRKDGAASFHAVGPSISVAGVSEAVFDAALFSLVASKVDGGIPTADLTDSTLVAALDRLHVAIRVARERLSSDESTFVGVRLPGRATVVHIERAEFEDAAAPLLAETLPALLDAILTATGGTGEAAAAPDELLLTGSAAPAPLIAALLAPDLDIPVIVSAARHGGSFGAAIAAAAAVPVLVPAAAVVPAAPPVPPAVPRKSPASVKKTTPTRPNGREPAVQPPAAKPPVTKPSVTKPSVTKPSRSKQPAAIAQNVSRASAAAAVAVAPPKSARAATPLPTTPVSTAPAPTTLVPTTLVPTMRMPRAAILGQKSGPRRSSVVASMTASATAIAEAAAAATAESEAIAIGIPIAGAKGSTASLIQSAPVSAAVHVNAVRPTSASARVKRRRPVSVLNLWPVAAAAAVLAVLGGAATVGAMDLTPSGTDRVTSPARPATDDARTPSSTRSHADPDGVQSDVVAGTAPGATNRSPGTQRRTTSPSVIPGAANPSSSSGSSSPSASPSSSAPSPTPTSPDPDSPTPTPTPTDTGDPAPTPSGSDSSGDTDTGIGATITP